MSKPKRTNKPDLLPALHELDTISTVPITDQSSLREATALLSRLNQYLDSIIEYKEKKTKPLNEALKVIRSETKPYETKVQTLIDSIRLSMTTYQTSLVNAQKAEEASITARIAPGKGNLSLDTAIKKLEQLPTIEKEIPTEEGLVQFREKKQLKITNEALIPRNFLIPDEKRMFEHLLNGGNNIPGAEIEIIQVPVNYR